MKFLPIAICKGCAAPIMLIDGMWCDETIAKIEATPSFAAMCETGSEHRPA